MSGWSVMYDGSWQVVDLTDKSFGGQLIICDCGIDPWSEMNARKIAAAPELADALEMMLRAWEEVGGSDRLIGYQKGVEALAKAGAA